MLPESEETSAEPDNRTFSKEKRKEEEHVAGANALFVVSMNVLEGYQENKNLRNGASIARREQGI